MNQADLEKESLQIVKREGFADLQAQAAIDSIDVSEWHPLPDGQGKPTQVHVSMMIDGLDVPLVMRFKGPGKMETIQRDVQLFRIVGGVIKVERGQ